MTSKDEWCSVQIISDDSDDEVIEIVPKKKIIRNKKQIETNEIQTGTNKKKEVKVKQQHVLKTCLNNDINIIEIGIDEAGRGPMLGRVYAGAVVLPKDVTLFKHELMKDSKKFGKSKKAHKVICEVAQYIKDNAIAWSVQYEDEQTIDNINILQATQSAMHKVIKDVLCQLKIKFGEDFDTNNIHLLVDGNYFKPYTITNKTKNKLESLKYSTIEQGDNTYTSIAAASILAKVERDNYIDELCKENPELIERYGIDSNKGYGSKKHMEGIEQFGITKWHRKTFGICKKFA